MYMKYSSVLTNYNKFPLKKKTITDITRTPITCYYDDNVKNYKIIMTFTYLGNLHKISMASTVIFPNLSNALPRISHNKVSEQKKNLYMFHISMICAEDGILICRTKLFTV